MLPPLATCALQQSPAYFLVIFPPLDVYLHTRVSALTSADRSVTHIYTHVQTHAHARASVQISARRQLPLFHSTGSLHVYTYLCTHGTHVCTHMSMHIRSHVCAQVRDGIHCQGPPQCADGRRGHMCVDMCVGVCTDICAWTCLYTCE